MEEEDGSDTRGQTYPSLFLSMTPGNIECTYVDVQMINSMTRRSDWKLKIAVCHG